MTTKNTLDPRALLEGTSKGWKLSLTDDTMVIDADRNEVACVAGNYNDPDHWPIMEANARLIAAAPQLAQSNIAMSERIAELEGALTYAAGLFRKYEQMHLDKGTDDGRDKAERNRDAAEVCEAALSQGADR